MSQRSEEVGLRQFDLNLLPVFAALMRERSVTRAAQTLFLSQPATSAALRRLRAFFGDPLFIRSGHRLEPTPRAEVLMAQLAPALQSMAGAVSAAIPFNPTQDARTFRVGMSGDIALAVFPLLRQLRKEAPNCRIILRSASYRTAPAMLESREISMAIGHLEDLPAAAKMRVLRRDGWRVLRDASTPGPIDLDSYCERPHLIVTARGVLTSFVDEELQKLGRSRQVVLGVPDFALVPRTLLDTDLLCLVPESLLQALSHFGPNQPLASDPPPIACPESLTHMAWRTASDQDPAEVWLRTRLAEWLAHR
jgi:LysR family transcriptional activator of mexEF-oprN operon